MLQYEAITLMINSVNMQKSGSESLSHLRQIKSIILLFYVVDKSLVVEHPEYAVNFEHVGSLTGLSLSLYLIEHQCKILIQF